MALVVMCGQPRSGKSTVVRRLVQQLIEDLERGEAAAAGGSGTGGGGRLRVTVIDEASLNQGDRNASYKSMVQEKNLRGTLRSAVSRAVAKDCIVIVDSLNNIKGYRYELWCVARAAGIRYCVVYCRVSDDTPRLWNRSATVDSERAQEEDRKEEGASAATAYSQEILEDLLRRFEPPDSSNRWDSLLFELRLGPTPLPPRSDNTSHLRDPWSGDTEEVVVQRIAEVSRHATGASSTDAAFRGRGGTSLQPTIATQTGRSSDASALYLVDRATQDVLAAIADAQNRAGDEAAGLTSLGAGLPPIELRRRVGVAELQRHRRAYLRLAGQASLSGPRPPSDPLTCQRLFLEYLNRELE